MLRIIGCPRNSVMDAHRSNDRWSRGFLQPYRGSQADCVSLVNMNWPLILRSSHFPRLISGKGHCRIRCVVSSVPPIPSRRQGSAMLTSPRNPSSAMRLCSCALHLWPGSSARDTFFDLASCSLLLQMEKCLFSTPYCVSLSLDLVGTVVEVGLTKIKRKQRRHGLASVHQPFTQSPCPCSLTFRLGPIWREVQPDRS
jgi:hypothetical protein